MFFFNRFFIFIDALTLAILMVSCQEISSEKNNFIFSVSSAKDTLEVKRLLALSEKSLKSDFELSINQAIQATKLAEKTPFHALKFEAYKSVAKAALQAGTFEILEIYLQKFLVLAEREKDEKMIGRAYANLAMLHLYLNETNVADSLFKRGLSLLEHHAKLTHEKIPEEDQIVINLNLGHIYLDNKQLKKAESFYLNGLKLAQNNPAFVTYQGQLTQSLGIFYLQGKQAKKARQYLDLALEIQKRTQSDAMFPVSYLSFGQYYELIHLPNQALFAYKEGLIWAEKIKSISLKVELGQQLYRLYKAQGNSKEALNYLNFNLAQNALSKKDKARESRLRNSIERKILIQEAEQSDLQKKQSIYNLLILLLVVTVAIYFFRKSGHNSEKILSLTKEKVEKDKLSIEYELTQQKMAKNALVAYQKEQILNQVVKKIKQSQLDEGGNSGVLNNISRELEKINGTKNWDEFEKRFVGLHINFFPNLISAHPNLTNNERRLCAFLKIDLSTKEIAKLTGQTNRAIELSRVRLRKKLNLTHTEQGIFQYLATL
jgi:hypothetical protein